MNVLQSTAASAERVFELLDETEEEADPAAPVVLEHTRGHITLEDVSFRYLADTPLIDDLNLDVRPGETVAIVGPTGAGKTTLVNLLLRFYEIDHGRITIDGVDAHDMTRSDLRDLFGMVLQDTWLFSGTIRENIAYGREGATEDEVRAAAQAARVDHFVRTLPDGYDTVLDDDATAVSQGEKQLLTIARAFLSDPDILILDEATSSVDTRTEVLIQEAMAELMKGRTSFVIAHRLSTIRGADIILVMDHGHIIEQGIARGAHGGARLLLRPLRQPVRGGPRRGVVTANHRDIERCSEVWRGAPASANDVARVDLCIAAVRCSWSNGGSTNSTSKRPSVARQCRRHTLALARKGHLLRACREPRQLVWRTPRRNSRTVATASACSRALPSSSDGSARNEAYA